jgi:hypothetical protein
MPRNSVSVGAGWDFRLLYWRKAKKGMAIGVYQEYIPILYPQG